MEFFIPSELTDQELVIYVYNPDTDPVYFDELEIIRYKSVLNGFNSNRGNFKATNIVYEK